MARHLSARHVLAALLLVTLLGLVHYGLWRVANPPLDAPEVPARVAGLAYNAYGRWDSPLSGSQPVQEKIAADLAFLSAYTDRLRTYSAAEFPELPALAHRHGLRLTLGVWLDRRGDNNQKEIAAALAATRQPGVERVIAGNETQLHEKLPPAELYRHLDALRKSLKIPVSTAEPWHVWLDQPELARHVDFITVHLLPYWEGVPVEVALDVALQRYEMLRQRFPKKSIVIGEIGWPSRGETFTSGYGQAAATPAAQAQFVRTFLQRAAALKLDYYLMEAIDQPWKRLTEGAVGAHWGLLDASRAAKFDFSGPVFDAPHWRMQSTVAVMLGSLFALPVLLGFPGLRRTGRITYAIAAHGVAALLVLVAGLPFQDYLRPGDFAAFALLVPAALLAVAIVLTQGFEFVELFWPGSLHRVAGPLALPADRPPPLVSLHLACSNEPPDIVIATIDSLLALDWPALEILVVDNNTRDPALWRPLRRHIDRRRRELRAAGRDGISLRFFHLPRWRGFKAGALNFALARTDPRAAWIGVVDADYRVHPDWLRQVAGYFISSQVGIVQCPQAHRDWEDKLSKRMMNWEYDGFFRIGMHHRHERNAIIQHGTMTLVRADALRAAGGWDESCIVEDSELGLRLLARGWQAIYVDRVFGTGLVPADFVAWQGQRRRWAEGAMQILRRHAPKLCGRTAADARLSLGQRYHYLAGWLPWIGDALHLLFTLAALAWTVACLILPERIGLPPALFALPLMAFFLVRLVAGPLLYWRRVPCRPADIAAAALAGMALSHVIARGVWAGLTGRRAVFHVTRRSSASTPVRHAAGEESVLLAALAGALGLALAHLPADPGRSAWMIVLGLQALPYVAAVACAGLFRRDARRLLHGKPLALAQETAKQGV